jgi:two-component sensor histidine kinase
VTVSLAHDAQGLAVDVRDDGVGLPKGFDIERTTSLGLSIVRDLVVSQLDGSIGMHRVPRPEGGGTLVRIEVPAGARR